MVYGSLPSGLELKSLWSIQYLYHLVSTSDGAYMLANSIFYIYFYCFLKIHANLIKCLYFTVIVCSTFYIILHYTFSNHHALYITELSPTHIPRTRICKKTSGNAEFRTFCIPANLSMPACYSFLAADIYPLMNIRLNSSLQFVKTCTYLLNSPGILPEPL